MNDLRAVLKVEVQSPAKYALNDIFSHLAEEPEITVSPSIIDSPEPSVYFLRFSSPVFAEYALNHKLDVDGVSVLPVNENLTSVSQYLRARSNHLSSSSRTKSLGQQKATRDSLLIPKLTPGRLNFDPGVDVEPYANTRTDFALQPFPNAIREGKTEQNHPTDGSRHGHSGFPSKEAKPIPRTATPLSKEMKTKGDDPNLRATQGEILGIACETQIHLSICGDSGETITLDLENVCLEPKVIIELLKTTKSDRGNYWIVAAFYRRKKKPESARQVLLSMVEEFTRRGVSEQGLHPAYLLLSGCELDIARQAKIDKKEDFVIESHYSAAQKWLQRVFGKATSGVGKENRTGMEGGALEEKKRMEKEIGTLRRLVAKQEGEIAELKVWKRKRPDIE